MFVLFLIITGLVCVNSTPCSRDESLNITTGITFENGSVLYDGLEYVDGTWYVLDIDGLDVRFGCPCIGRRCLWKCCGIGQMFLNRTCADVDVSEANPFNPPVFKGRDPVNVIAHLNFFYMPRQSCEMYLVDSNSPVEEIYLQENGSLLEIATNRPQWHPPRMFCLDMKLDNSSPKSRLVGGVCYPDSGSNDDSPGLYIAYGIGLMLSVPFLLATFLVYAFIPELRNLHGMCLMAYCGGLIVAYPFLAYLKLHTGRVGVAMTGCFVIAFIIYYAFQSSFFWLNVMCFDIWRTFSGYRGGSSSKRRERKRFAMYGAYAWGVPALLTAVTIGMQFGTNIPDHIITPGFGHRRCWFDNWLSELVYFFIPVFVLVVCNVVLFSVTANRIRSIRQETAILKGAESSRSDKLKKDKQRYGLYLKLFVIMGVNWTVEVISFAVGGSNWYWIVVDLSNIALGIYIFFIFVWKNKVRSLIAKKWRSVRGLPADSTLGTWGTRSSSAPTEDTRVSADESGMRLKEIH
ncbi:G-protein coupled receptor Mth2-like [Pararge aegeria]|uniref:G-protein coupled receptor Mth2-like n=1 Tax=Pararge aegeria TaxID=116150 RepID=UPI0019D139D6|nr:G-protein coupled receptor Mth2-like [Pararge aegeria]